MLTVYKVLDDYHVKLGCEMNCNDVTHQCTKTEHGKPHKTSCQEFVSNVYTMSTEPL